MIKDNLFNLNAGLLSCNNVWFVLNNILCHRNAIVCSYKRNKTHFKRPCTDSCYQECCFHSLCLAARGSSQRKASCGYHHFALLHVKANFFVLWMSEASSAFSLKQNSRINFSFLIKKEATTLTTYLVLSPACSNYFLSQKVLSLTGPSTGWLKTYSDCRGSWTPTGQEGGYHQLPVLSRAAHCWGRSEENKNPTCHITCLKASRKVLIKYIYNTFKHIVLETRDIIGSWGLSIGVTVA